MVDPKLNANAQEQASNPKQNLELYSGVGSGVTPDISANPYVGDGERLLRGISNSFIILGNDRPAGPTSGYGGVGRAGSACVDIFVGPNGDRAVDSVFGEKVYTPKDFKNDAARIYISQRTDLDDNFGIPTIKVKLGGAQITDETSKELSGIGIKADNVRLIAAQNIKLVTSHSPAHLSNATLKKVPGGVCLMAGYDRYNEYDTDYVKKNPLEPMVRGDKLVLFLRKMIELIEELDSKTNNFIDLQNKFNRSLSTHVHQTGATGNPSGPMVGDDKKALIDYHTRTVPEIISTKIKEALMEQYFSVDSDGYINSRWHKLN